MRKFWLLPPSEFIISGVLAGLVLAAAIILFAYVVGLA